MGQGENTCVKASFVLEDDISCPIYFSELKIKHVNFPFFFFPK